MEGPLENLLEQLADVAIFNLDQNSAGGSVESEQNDPAPDRQSEGASVEPSVNEPLPHSNLSPSVLWRRRPQGVIPDHEVCRSAICQKNLQFQRSSSSSGFEDDTLVEEDSGEGNDFTADGGSDDGIDSDFFDADCDKQDQVCIFTDEENDVADNQTPSIHSSAVMPPRNYPVEIIYTSIWIILTAASYLLICMGLTGEDQEDSVFGWMSMERAVGWSGRFLDVGVLLAGTVIGEVIRRAANAGITSLQCGEKRTGVSRIAHHFHSISSQNEWSRYAEIIIAVFSAVFFVLTLVWAPWDPSYAVKMFACVCAYLIWRQFWKPSRIETREIMLGFENDGVGLACSYCYGYLNIILPEYFRRIEKVSLTTEKMLIVFIESCNIPTLDNIKALTPLTEILITKTRAGNKERIYQIKPYSVHARNGQKYDFTMDIPVIMKQLRKSTSETEQEKQHRKQQVRSFIQWVEDFVRKKNWEDRVLFVTCEDNNRVEDLVGKVQSAITATTKGKVNGHAVRTMI